MAGLNSKRIVNQGVQDTFGLGGTSGGAPTSIIEGPIQSVILTLNPGGLTTTATITAVDLTRSMIVRSGGYNNNGLVDRYYRLSFDNSTTVRVTRGNSIGTLTVRLQVVQFRANVINSVNRGTITISGPTSTNSATIPAVNVANSICYSAGWSTVTNASSQQPSYLTLGSTSVTSTTASNVGSSDNLHNFQVIEFVNGYIARQALTYTANYTTEVSTVYNFIPGFYYDNQVAFESGYTAQTTQVDQKDIVTLKAETAVNYPTSANKITTIGYNRVSFLQGVRQQYDFPVGNATATKTITLPKPFLDYQKVMVMSEGRHGLNPYVEVISNNQITLNTAVGQSIITNLSIVEFY